jgi:site-specific DNA-methyltransferase (adenine-specific)
MITWQKTNPPPNLACRSFKHSTEFIIWAVKDKSKYFFNYDLMKELNGGKQMTDVWTGALTPQSEKHFGKHPTQKPTYLLERIIQAASKQGDWVLDPFCGSGTTGGVAAQKSRNFVGIDISDEYIELSRNRINHEMNVIVE